MRKNQVSITEAIKRLAKRQNTLHLYYEVRVEEALHQILGTIFMEKITEIQLTPKLELTLRINSPLVRNELNLAKEKIRTSLNEELQDIEIQKVVIN